MIPNLSANRTAIVKTAAVAAYFLALVIGCVLIWTSIAAVSEARTSLSAAEGMLAQLEGHSLPRHREHAGVLDGAPAGSPFLEGRTLNVAGATLLQRVGAAVHRAGGNILSSQVDLDGARSKNGWIDLAVSCDIEQASLQPLLYDIEAGMPFLFVDQLVVQAPTQGVSGNRMKVLLGVSGQWWNGK
jgi:general secretion pathway protein M